MANSVSGQRIRALEFQISELNLSTDGFYRQSAQEVLRLLKPSKVIGAQPVRIGNEGDGSYYLVPDFSQQDTVFSIGIGDEVSFDNQLVQSVGKVIMVDHTVPSFKPNHKSMVMLHKKLSVGQSQEVIDFTFLFTSFPSKDYILKMDIEGDEWKILDSLPSEDLEKFRQIAIEFHGLTKLEGSFQRSQVLRVLNKINDTHVAFFLHANNNGSFRVCGNILIPDVVEVSYLRKSDFEYTDQLFSFEHLDISQNSKTRDPISMEWIQSIFMKSAT